MNRPSTSIRFVRSALSAVTLGVFLLIPCQLGAQSATTPNAADPHAQPQTGTSPPSVTREPAVTPSDDLAQMRIDLDRMESLLGNMSSEIEFLRDQNLQILLRTNAQIWTMLIRDLRRQVDREVQQRGRGVQPEAEGAPPKAKPH